MDIDPSILIPENAGKNLTWTIFSNVSLVGNVTLELGEVLKTIVENGKPMVTLSGAWVNNDEHSLDLTSGDLVNLHTGTGGLLSGSVTTGGDLVVTVTNMPEPTTGTLSVLALAALAARRRRRK